MSITLRDAGAADAAAIAALHTASWRATYRGVLDDAYLDGALAEEHAARWAHKLAAPTPDDVVLLAETAAEAAPIGFIAVWPDPRLARGGFIDNLHAAPAHRGHGVGAALFRAAADRLLAAGRRQAWLTVFPDNHGAVRFYERLGGRRGLDMAAEIGGRSCVATVYYWRDLATLDGRTRA